MLGTLHRCVRAASPCPPVLLPVLLAFLALFGTAAAQQSTKILMFDVKSSSVYDISKNGSALTSTYSSPNRVARFGVLSVVGDVFAVVVDSTANTQPPSPPLIASAGESSPGCVQVSWLPTGDPTVVGYEIGIGLRSVAGGDAPSYDRVVDAEGISDHVLCQLATGHYFTAVRSKNHLGIPSVFSSEIAVDVTATAVVISAFEARAENGAVTLEWDVFSDEALQGYRLSRAEEDESGRGSPIHGQGTLPPGTRSLEDRSVHAGNWYRYTLVVIREDGTEAAWLSRTVRAVPTALELDQNVPNPFNPQTSISFVLPAAQRVRLDVFDVGGRLVKTLVDGGMPTGRHHVAWNGTDNNGTPVATGAYFYRLTAGKKSLSRKMLLLK